MQPVFMLIALHPVKVFKMDTVLNSFRNRFREDAKSSRGLGLFSFLQIRKSSPSDWWIRLATLILPTIYLAVVVFQPWVEPKWMFLDPLTAAQLSGDCCHSHYGFVSTAGVILWAATSAVCLFTAGLLLISKARIGLVAFPLLAGLLTSWLTLDDAFLLHETVFPAFGVPQNAVIATYMALGIAYFGLNWRNIMQWDYWLLAMGAAALFASIVIDVVFHSLNPNMVLLEDSAKFFGIFCWMSFHVTTFAKILSGRSERRSWDV